MRATGLRLPFLAPIAVGRIVTLRSVERAVFAADGSGIVGYSKVEQPLVRDDESGIVYCTPFFVP